MRRSTLVIAVSLSLIIAIVVVYILNQEQATERELFDQAQLFHSQGNFDEAIKTYKKIMDEYPIGEHRSKAIFMLGFLYANEIKDYEKAEEYYNMVLRDYPDDELNPSARFELDNLGKDIAEFDSIFQDVETGGNVKKDTNRD